MQLAWRRMRRNKVSLGFGVLFLVIVALCLLAPVYSNDIAHIGPADGNPTGQINVGGKKRVHPQHDRDPDRADLDQPLLPRRRRQRP